MIHEVYRQTIFAAKEPTPNPWPATFGIVTACNPPDRGLDAAEDIKATTELRRAIARRGFSRHRVTGMSPDWSHQEPGFAIWGCELRDIVELGKRFRQNAVFWIDHGKIEVVSCMTEERQFVALWSERLHRWSDRPTCRIYVIRLDPSVLKLKKVRAKNPGCAENAICLYVGKTGKTPEERFAEHKRGYRSSAIVKKYGLRLDYPMFRDLPVLSDSEARGVEVSHAAALREKGYAVWQN